MCLLWEPKSLALSLKNSWVVKLSPVLDKDPAKAGWLPSSPEHILT